MVILKIVGLILSNEKTDPNIQDFSGDTILTYAVRPTRKSIELVELVLKNEKIDINMQNGQGETALSIAADQKGPLKLLLADERLNLNNECGKSILFDVCRNGKTELLRLMLKNKTININIEFSSSDRTPLIAASAYGHIDAVKLLLERKDIDINIQDMHGWTAFMHVNLKRRTDIAKLFLLNPDLAINIKDEYGNTALDYIKDASFKALVIMLFDENYKIFSALYRAIGLNKFEKVVEIIESSPRDYGYWGSCTFEKKLALQAAEEFKVSEIHDYLCKVWNVPSSDSWKSTAVEALEWICNNVHNSEL